MLKSTLITLLLLAASAIPIWVEAQNIYKCGSSYSQTPCAGGQVLNVDDARSPAQQQQTQEATNNAKKLADQLFDEMENRFPGQVGVIHSNKAQNNRFETVRRFQEGEDLVLIATDIVARGLDLTGVSHVINFDLPEEPENYIHRIGRTGRADQEGIAISFISEREKEFQEKIEELMNYEIPKVPLPEKLEISEVLTREEEPQIEMKNILIKPPKRDDVGPAFHEKIDKNKKVNVRRDIAAEKMAKYGRPIRRGAKKGKS